MEDGRETGVGDGGLAGIGSVAWPADRNPVAVYLARLAPGSRRAMLQGLRALVALAGDEGGDGRAVRAVAREAVFAFPWHRLGYAHTQALRARLAARYAPASANKILCALRGVLDVCVRLELMEPEARARAADVRAVRGARLLRGRALTAGELRSLFAACGGDGAQSLRDAALLAVLYGAGLRRAEAVGLRCDDFDLAQTSLRVRGKGDRHRLVPVAPGAVTAVLRWFAVRGGGEGPLFTRVRRGGVVSAKGMSGQAVLKILQRLAARAGVAPFSPHDARRTFISDLLDAGADLSTVQQLAGHAQVTTTARYDRRGEHARRRAVGLLHIPVVGG